VNVRRLSDFRGCRGMSLVPALFLLIVVAALATFAVRIGSAQQQTASLALLGDRALAAAAAGAEWAAYRALNNGLCTNAALPLGEAALQGFQVQVTCSSTSHTEGAITYRTFDIDTFAQWGTFGSADYVSRSVHKRINNGP
jgi:MSHA biogenesis protein MshP